MADTPALAAVILAAGQGTRMKSTRAKVLFEVGGEPMITWPLRRACALGAAPIITVVGHQAETVQGSVRARFGDTVQFALQAERLGTGHAAQVGMSKLQDFQGVVLILSGDVPLLEEASLRALVKTLEPGRPVAVLSTELKDPTGYGRIVRDEAQRVVRIVEHKDASPEERAITEINAGIYAVDAQFLRQALSKISNNNAQKEYYITDIVHLALQDDLEVAGLVVDAEEVQGANNRAQLAQLEALARRRTIERHLEAGVSFLDPEQTYVGPEVKIEPDCTIYPGVHLRGSTRLGARVTVEVGSIIRDSEISNDAVIHPYSIIENARVEAQGQIGPFARLRPGAHIGIESRVGNFVEIKKSTLGPKAKANHLSYIGDASIGAGTNVGAGTITCNYDGIGKYHTEIGSGVFVGSNTTLIAPLQVGDKSYVAAGSVLSEDVPEGSLVLGRARQINKLGRADNVREKAEERKKAKADVRSPSQVKE